MATVPKPPDSTRAEKSPEPIEEPRDASDFELQPTDEQDREAKSPKVLVKFSPPTPEGVLLYHEATAAYDKIIRSLGNAEDLQSREKVADALLSKASKLVELGHRKEAVTIYDEAVTRFGRGVELSLRERVATALLKKEDILSSTIFRIGKCEDAIAVCDDIVARFGDDPEVSLRDRAAKALHSKAFSLNHRAARKEEAIVVYDDLIVRFGNESEVSLREKVARALVNKGNILVDLKRPEEAITIYDQATKRFGDSDDGVICEQVNRALIDKSDVLSDLNRAEDAVKTLSELLARLAGWNHPVFLKQTAIALINLGALHNKFVRSKKLKGEYLRGWLGTRREPRAADDYRDIIHSFACSLSLYSSSATNIIDVSKDKAHTLEAPPTTASVETTAATQLERQKDEGDVLHSDGFYKSLDNFLADEQVPEETRPSLIAEFRRMIARAKPSRPTWQGRKERGGELATLTAPLFLKRVYAHEIAPDGVVYKDLIRELDSKLMDAVETYISSRASRGRDLGDAAGLVFITSRPPTNAVYATSLKLAKP